MAILPCLVFLFKKFIAVNILGFAEQSFIDEVAIAAGKNPVEFSLSLLQKARTTAAGAIIYNIDRMETVIKKAAEVSGWGNKSGVSQGFSVYFSHASYVAQVCEVVMNGIIPVIKKYMLFPIAGKWLIKVGHYSRYWEAL